MFLPLTSSFRKESAMKRLPFLLCAALLCSTLAGCAYDYRGPAVGGAVAVAPSGVYTGSVAVGTVYAPSPFVVPVLPPLIVGSHYRHHPRPVYRHVPPPVPHRPAFRPAPPPRPHGPALRPGPHPDRRPPAMRPGGPSKHRPPVMGGAPRPAHRGPAVKSGSHRGPRPHPAGSGRGPRGGHGGPR